MNELTTLKKLTNSKILCLSSILPLFGFSTEKKFQNPTVPKSVVLYSPLQEVPPRGIKKKKKKCLFLKLGKAYRFRT